MSVLGKIGKIITAPITGFYRFIMGFSNFLGALWRILIFLAAVFIVLFFVSDTVRSWTYGAIEYFKTRDKASDRPRLVLRPEIVVPKQKPAPSPKPAVVVPASMPARPGKMELQMNAVALGILLDDEMKEAEKHGKFLEAAEERLKGRKPGDTIVVGGEERTYEWVLDSRDRFRDKRNACLAKADDLKKQLSVVKAELGRQ